jgi:hypothetical protein
MSVLPSPVLRSRVQRSLKNLLVLALFTRQFAPAQQPAPVHFPFQEVLTYRVEWGLITAGTVNLEFRHSDPSTWSINLDVESYGMVNRFHRVQDKYTVSGNEHFCPTASSLDAQEGAKHKVTHLTFDPGAQAVDYIERDLVKKTNKEQHLTVPNCTHEIAGGLAALGEMNVPPGRSVSLPMTDGKKMVYAKIDAQAHETVNIDGKSYSTIRYEAFLFDNVLYKRKGRVFLWLTDDPERVPVQFRLQFGFPVGNISLELEKQQKL